MQNTPEQDNQEPTVHFLDYWRVIRSRKEIILAVAMLVVLTGAAFTLTLPKTYMAEARIEVSQDALDVEPFNRPMGATRYNPYFLRTEYERLKSKPLLYKVVKNLNLQKEWTEDGMDPLSPAQALSRLRRNLVVEQYRDTSLIALRFYGEDPEEAALIANELASVYHDHRLEMKSREVRDGITSLKNELKKQKDLVDTAEENLENIRQELGVSLVARGVPSDRLRISKLEGDRSAARVELLVSEVRLKELEALQGDESIDAALYMVNDATLMSLRKQLIDTELSLTLMLESLGNNHPDVLRVEKAVLELKSKLNTALEGMKTGVRASYKVSKARFDVLEEELEQVKELDRLQEREQNVPFAKAQRELDIQRSILTALRARVAQQGIEMNISRTPVQLVDPAEAPRRPISPNIFLNVLLSAILGLGAGIGLAYFLEYLDTSVKTVDDVERYLGLPVLGVIPQKVRPLINEGPDSPHAEAYRVLRTNMQFESKGVRGGAYCVVSGGVGEGKSTTLVNLAYICAQLGDKVLVVDSDLRRPVLHTTMGMSNKFGLTNVLLRDVPIEETIKATEVPNLHFIPSGRLPKSSLGVLDSQKMSDLVKNLKARYDWIFFDSPPIMGVSDASILASEVDGVLLVVQYRKYPRIISLRAKRTLDNVGANLLGVVLNNINILRDDYYYYYHSYYSHYHASEEALATDEETAARAAEKQETY